MARIAFINPPAPDGAIYMKELGRCGRRSVGGEIWPQTGLAYLASYVREAGHEPQIWDGMALAKSPEIIAEEIVDFRPDLIVTHVTTPTYRIDKAFTGTLRRRLPETVMTLVGTHVSAVGAPTLDDFEVDALVVGEGEETIAEMAALLDAGEDRESLPLASAAIAGLWFRNGDGKPHYTGDRKANRELDDFPLPARDLLPVRNYMMPFFPGEPFVTIISNRGCPVPCIFCRAGTVWGRRVRQRSVASVIGEIAHVRERHGINNFVFMTDIFTFYRDWVAEFCREVKDLGIHWICNSRVDMVDTDVLRAMREAGCRLISFGLESGDQTILDRARKQIRLEDSRRAIAATKEAGITAFGYFIIGLPGETWETVERTIQFAIEIDPDYALFHIATPFPGTELYRYAQEHNLLLSEDWADFDEQQGCAMRTEAMTAEELQKAKSLAMRRFYTRPRRLARELFSVRNMSELKTKLHAGWRMLASGSA